MKFSSLDSYTVAGRQVFIVENPFECPDFKHLIGVSVEIDGAQKVIYAVEHFAHLPPYRKGEKIGIAVK